MRNYTKMGVGLLALLVPAVASHYLQQQEARKLARLRVIFQLPPEAVIVSGKDTEWLGIAADVEFRLPPTRSPKHWLQFLVKRNNATVLTRQRQNPLRYTCREDCNHGITTLEYVPVRDLYKSSYYED